MDYRDLYREGKFAEALTALDQSPEAVKKSYTYYFNRGIIHHALNQDSLAVANLEKARVLNPATSEWKLPLDEARNGLSKTLGSTRLDSTSMVIETAGDALPLDVALIAFGGLSLICWVGFLVAKKKKGFFLQAGFATLIVAILLGGLGLWMDHHPLWIATESRTVKSGPGESYLDRGTVETGMKLRVEGTMTSSDSKGPDSKDSAPKSPSGSKWLRVRFNEKHDSGYVPEQSGLLLTDESNTPES